MRRMGWAHYLRQMATNMSRNVQDLFGTAEAAIYTRPDSTPQREAGPPADNHAHTSGQPAGKADRLPPRERRGRD